MTWTLAPDAPEKRTHLGPRHIGPYYGAALRDLRHAAPSPIQRATDWYRARRWPARVLAGVGLILVAATIAGVIVGGW